MCMHACLTVLGRSVFVGNATTVGSRVNAVVGESRDGMVTESRVTKAGQVQPARSFSIASLSDTTSAILACMSKIFAS
jgi:hypothetical protein